MKNILWFFYIFILVHCIIKFWAGADPAIPEDWNAAECAALAWSDKETAGEAGGGRDETPSRDDGEKEGSQGDCRGKEGEETSRATCEKCMIANNIIIIRVLYGAYIHL